MNARSICCVYVAATCFILAGCSKLDSGVSWAPSSIKDAPPSPSTVPPDQRPNLDAILRQQAAKDFSGIQSIEAGEPKPNGMHWQFCAKIVSSGVMGGTIADTYVIEIASGVIQDRRKDTHNVCAGTIYRPIAFKN